ncbi:unnamed protein product [Rhizoctonia solani]|uniref:Uncharacterized protein n=1 Tax=Rhizoctonia solani TaxID=456999 RepID=A0A8H3I348_9AGAM|nr:unnamed protein product [Rhizoctonia solani]CAE7223893.1 unnamed protein product [Rhizoctonia solani]
MPFISLPPETIVCRYLKETIANDLYLQYILQLDKFGYIAPQLIRQDLGYGEMIEAVGRWQHAELGEPEFIKIPDAIDVVAHRSYFMEGIYVLYLVAMDSSSNFKFSLHFHELPSFNRGTGYRYWVHDGLGFHVCSFSIQPEIDLLVLLYYLPFELVPGYCIHLRTMSTNEPHPLAAASPLLNIDGLPDLQPDDSNEIIIFGRILAHLLNIPESKPFIILFDWIAGIEIGRIDLEPSERSTIAFISEEYCAVTRDRKYNISSTDTDDQARNILIFHITPHTEELQDRRVMHVVTLEFPTLCKHQTELGLRLCGRASPIPDSPFWSNQTKPVPKIYELKRWGHLCLYYEADTPRTSSYPPRYFEEELNTSGILYISSQALLAALAGQYLSYRQSDEPVLIPWKTWKEHAARQPAMDLPGANMWGRKSASIQHGAEAHSNHERPPQLVILDFIPKGVSTRQSSGNKEVDSRFSVLDCSSRAYNQTCATSSQLTDGGFTETKLDMRYRRISIDLKSVKHQEFRVHGFQVDDEHIVTAIERPRNVTGQQFFRVYTI